MPDIPILGQTKPAPAAAPSIDDLTPEQQAALDALAASEEIEKTTVSTAFVVWVDTEGGVVATGDLAAAATLAPERPASADDIYGACASVQKSISAQETAGFTQRAMIAMSQAVARQQQEQQIMSQIAPKLR